MRGENIPIQARLIEVQGTSKDGSLLGSIPNLLSFSRLMGAPVTFWLLINQRLVPASLLFLLLSATDWFDGWLARRYAWQTPLGKLLDPAADKLLVVLCCLGLGAIGQLPWWIVALILGRDGILLLGSFMVLYHRWPMDLSPSLLSKINTVLQFTLILNGMIRPLFPALSGDIFFEGELLYTVAITTLLSGLGYMYGFYRHLSNS